MALWGDKDILADAPKYLIDGANTAIVPAVTNQVDYDGLAPQLDVNNAVFADTDEIEIVENREKGFKIPGWHSYTTYTDSNGETRHKGEPLVRIRADSAYAGDDGVSGTGDDNTIPNVGIPGIPLNVTYDNIGDDSFEIVWEEPEYTGGTTITSYDAQWRLAGDDVNINDETGVSSPEVIGVLSAETEYEFRVRANNSEGSSDWSDWVLVETLPS